MYWKIDSYEGYEKDLLISGPEELRLSVDWDDVDRIETCLELQKMFTILNDWWDDPKYRKAEYPESPSEEQEEEFDKYWDERCEYAREFMHKLAGENNEKE